jgi:7-cyano-7-deazaguanine synthase in queuosine biosynthesis
MNTENCTIAMVSGGLDSIAMLYNLLNDTNEDIIVHRVNFLNAENRNKIESYCAKKCFNYLKNNKRNFYITESTIDLNNFSIFGYDIIHVMYIAGIIYKNYCQNYRKIKIACGKTKVDLESYSVASKHYAKVVAWTTQLSHLALSLSCSQTKDDAEIYEFPSIVYPVSQKTKTELKNSIPKELFDYTWSCRNPIYNGKVAKNCGRCISCKDLVHANIFTYKSISFD